MSWRGVDTPLQLFELTLLSSDLEDCANRLMGHIEVAGNTPQPLTLRPLNYVRPLVDFRNLKLPRSSGIAPVSRPPIYEQLALKVQ